MRTKFIYILLLVAGFLFSCQKSEFAEREKPVQGMEVGNEATISFSAIVPGNPETKAMSETPTDLETMHLVVFDGNGMYVETKEAEIKSAKTHDGHNYETSFEVTLTVTDQPRIIHFIANCPVEQILYGHEASIIGNMYTTKSNYNEDDKTDYETAYWARIKVPYILVEETAQGSGKYKPVPGIIGSFKCIPMLRNYAQVVVKDGSNTTEFELLGFTLYNTIDKGTIAPYNNTTQMFQNFVDQTGKAYKYPNLAYQGHALAAAYLNTSLEMIPDDGTQYWDGYKWYDKDNPFYMYERKISVKTDEEEKWKESPPHVIIKGLYNGKINYYKVDLVYKVYGNTENSDQVTDIKYYNILRNFRYQFTISEVVGEGYPTVPDAIKGATSNNLAGSSTTSKFTNISDKVGRIWVSYTDTTLVSSNNITFRYKYQPDITVDAIDNDEVDLENIIGTVIKSYKTATAEDSEFTHHQYNTTTKDIQGGEWDGFRELILTINNPEEMTKDQTIVVRTDNANLTRDVRFYLKQKYTLVVECTPKVEAIIGAPVEVDIKLPVGLTDDMFPLDLDIEVYNMSLSPDASYNNNVMPVITGPSTIAEKNGANTFHYVKSIETKEEYDNIEAVGTQKTIKTYWLTNIAANESTVYVSNKYFNVGKKNFVNAKSFVSLTLNGGNTVREGAGRTVSATLVLPDSDNSYTSRNIKFTLEGLSRNGSTDPFYITPTSRTITINNLVTTDANSTLKITAEEDSYAEISASVGRRRGTFSNLTFSQNNNTVTSVPLSSAQDVTFSFEMSDYENGMPITVVLEGFETTKAGYTHTVSGTGKQTINLTAPANVSNCSVQLKAEGYDDSQIISLERRDMITYSGTDIEITISNVDRPSLNGGGNNNDVYSARIDKITVNGEDVEFTGEAKYTYSNPPKTLTITLSSITISGQNITTNSNVVISYTITRTKGNITATKEGKYNTTINNLGLKKQ